MVRTPGEHNLLLGLLGLDLGLYDAEQLLAALGSWVRDRRRAFLCDDRILAETDVRALEALLRTILDRDALEPAQRFNPLLPREFVSAVVALDDAELRDALALLSKGPAAVTIDHPIATADLATLPPRSMPRGLAPSPSADGWVRYRIIRRHASGGLGTVYLAHDEELQREVALKEIQPEHAERTDSRARFLLEGVITGRLEHPGIVPIYGLGIYGDGRPYYAMRFIRGESLTQAVAAHHRRTDGESALRLRKLLSRFVDVCNAVEYAHNRGVLHRDLKPDNIMLGDFGETLVVDWGLAKEMKSIPPQGTGGEPTGRSGSLGGTLDGQIVGTPQYMPPEQAAGRIDLTPAADIYSLGATLYHLLAGQSPFPVEQDVFKTLRMVESGAFPPPRETNPSVPRALESVVLKAMAHRPEDRYPSARELAGDVERWLADEPVTAFQEPWTTRLRRWAKRHRTTVIAAAVLCITAVVALGISYVLLAREQQKTEEAVRDRALAQVETLLEAGPQAVPALLEGLESVRELVRPRLVELVDSEDENPTRRIRHQTRAALALLGDRPETAGFLLRRMIEPELDPEECLLIRGLLASRGPELSKELWLNVNDAKTTSEPRFRALVALAEFDPQNPRWEAAADHVVAPLLKADPLHVGIWTRALHPVREHLIGPLSVVFSDPKLPTERQRAALVLREYLADDLDLLVELLGRASPLQLPLLLPRLREHREASRHLHLALQTDTRIDGDEDRESDGRRRANLAAALLIHGDDEPAWNLLRHGPYPDARTQLVHLLPTLDLDAGIIAARLLREKDAAVRAALVLALGGCSAEQLPPSTREEIVEQLLAWYRDEPDAGLHSAIDWLLRHAREGEQQRLLAWEQAAALDRIDDRLRGKPVGKKRWYVAPHGETMVVLGPATFRMGSPKSEDEHENDEELHDRRIPRRFAISTRETTVRRFEQFLKDVGGIDHKKPGKYSPEPDCPIVNVSFYEAAMYCRRLSEQENLGEAAMCFPTIDEIKACMKDRRPLPLPKDYLKRTGYRLPTEAEWEYACRAGSLTSRPHGVSNELMAHYAWDVRNALARTWPVGQKKPNDFGLFDMHGNAAEWCLSLYAPYPVKKDGSVVEDVETIDAVPPDKMCILRGAPFHPRPTPLRSAYRYMHLPSDQFSTVGLRVARTLP